MTKVKNLIKLTNLNSGRLKEKELKHVIGGGCQCGCYYANCGGPSYGTNGYYNNKSGKVSIFPSISSEWG